MQRLRCDRTADGGMIMTKGIRYAVAMINDDIDLRAIDDFKSEFDKSSNTFAFVNNCTIDNKLDWYMVNTYMDDTAKSYLFNILHFWCNIGYENAERIVNL